MGVFVPIEWAQLYWSSGCVLSHIGSVFFYTHYLLLPQDTPNTSETPLQPHPPQPMPRPSQPMPRQDEDDDLQMAMALSLQTLSVNDELKKREEDELEMVLKLSLQDQ